MGKEQADPNVYKTLKDINDDLIKNLHEKTEFRYRWNVTQKYIQLKCEKCKLFAYWYKNKEDIDIGTLYEGDGKKTFLRPK